MLRVLAQIQKSIFWAPDVAKLLLDLPDGLKVSCAVECVPAHEEELDQIPRDVAPGDVKSPREVRERKAVVYGHDVRHAIARVDHDAGRQACIVSALLQSMAPHQRRKGRGMGDGGGGEKDNNKEKEAHLAHRA